MSDELPFNEGMLNEIGAIRMMTHALTEILDKVGIIQKALPQPPVKPVKKHSLRLSNSEGLTNFFWYL